MQTQTLPTPKVTSTPKDRWVNNLMGQLDLRQKIGQLFVFPFYGTFITPDVKTLIKDYHVGGLRVAQKFAAGMAEHRKAGLSWHEQKSVAPVDHLTFDRPPSLDRVYCTPTEFATALNTLRDFALDRPGSVPIHTAFDQEGEGADFLFGQRFFPYPMGIVNAGDPSLAYRVARGVGLQSRALGANMIHSPVLDVNTEPNNPEIGPRAYGETVEDVITYALEGLRGFQETGIIATAKHFPGRGASDTDAHFGLPVIDLDAETFWRDHLAPYRALIEAGLPAVMAAFTAYPQLGSSEPAATAPEIITGILRHELGFQGVVTTDNTQMGGLLEKYPIEEAVIRCLIAGCDLVLCRAYTPVRFKLLSTTREAVESGRISEARLDEAVERILRMRWDMGLAENGGKVDAARAGDPFYSEEVMETARTAARKTVQIQRNTAGLIPLPQGKRILLVEQVHHFHRFVNDGYSHPGLLWESLLQFRPEIEAIQIEEKVTEADLQAIQARLEGVDVIVSTAYYNYRARASLDPLFKLLEGTGKPIVYVSNTPYSQFGAPADSPSVIVSYCPSGKENVEAVAEVLSGVS
jgi:beta-N-acetylhexosaminidase